MLCLLASLAALPFARAGAAPLPNGDRVISYVVVEQDLREVLAEVGRQAGVHVLLTEAVTGRVHGRQPPATLGAYLDQLGDVFGVEWYYDGGALHFSAAHENASKVIELHGVHRADLEGALAAMSVADPRWPVRGAPDVDFVLVDGPPRYLELVEQVAKAMHPPSPAQAPRPTRVFYGSTPR